MNSILVFLISFCLVSTLITVWMISLAIGRIEGRIDEIYMYVRDTRGDTDDSN